MHGSIDFIMAVVTAGGQIGAQSNERVVSARASWAARVSGARVDGEAVGGAGMMAELSPVLLEQRRGPWSDCRQSAGADARAGAHPAFRFCNAFVRGRKGRRQG